MDDPTRADADCWQCGAPASAATAYTVLLVAHPSRRLDTLGYQITHETRRDRLRIPVPRCRACRARNRLSVIIVFGGAAAGAIIVPILQALFWPQIKAPPWLDVSHVGIGGTGTGIGLVLGFVVALLGVVLYRRHLGARALNTYPPIVTLREAGWHYPE